MKENIKILPFPNIENAYLVISFSKIKEPHPHTETCISFLYDNSNGVAAEWEPKYGPITVMYKCEKEHPDATPYWFWDYCTGFGNWSQLAVEEKGLPEALYSGDYEYIFNVLKEWC